MSMHSFSLLPGAAARTCVMIAALALPWGGCVSAQTTQGLRDTYEAATRRLADRAPPTEVAPGVDLAAPLERDAVVALAVARNPALTAMAHRARAMIHAGRAEGLLPSPEVGVAAQNVPLTRPYALGDAGMYMVELQQRFPAAGSLDARARSMTEEAQAMLAELTTEERMTAQRAADAFAEYAQGTEEHELQERQLALLARMSEAIRARYSTGGAALTDAARIELEVANTRRGVARTEGDVARARASLNALLRRPVSAPLGAPRGVAPETVRLTLDDLLARAATSRGATLAADARVRAARARRDAADAESRNPELMVGLGYWQDPRMRPGFGLSFSMSLPWLWGPQHERVAQAQEEEAAETSSRDAANVDAQSEIAEAHAKLAAIEAQLLVVDAQALPAVGRALDALAAAYVTGNANLLEWVDAARSTLELEMEKASLNGDLAHSIAALEQAVGAPLPRTPLTLEDRP
jgi:cobalt-zinc-cadmium efflux system outer membrane protein